MPRETLLRELRALSKRELALTLKSFTADERTLVLALIRPPAAAPEEVPFSVLSQLSPWLLKAIEPDRGTGCPASLTPATRTALKAALNEVAAEQTRAQAPQFGSHSFVGRLLRARREARAQ